MTDDGYWPCNLKRPRKRSYATLEEAWLTAFTLSAWGIVEFPVVPYKCATSRMWIGVIQPDYAQLNPWRWSPAWVSRPIKMKRVHGKWDRKNRCGLWHLTRSHAHILAPNTRVRELRDRIDQME